MEAQYNTIDVYVSMNTTETINCLIKPLHLSPRHLDCDAV
jgi:hypothetical protein